MTRAESEPRQLELNIPSPEDETIANISRAIAKQHLRDRESNYPIDPIIQEQRDENWGRIVRLNPQFFKVVMALKDEFDRGRKYYDKTTPEVVVVGEEWEDGKYYYSFNQVENPDLRAVLKDILRMRTGATVLMEEIEDEECDMYKEITKDPFIRLKDETYPKLEGFSPEKIIELILTGQLFISWEFKQSLPESQRKRKLTKISKLLIPTSTTSTSEVEFS